MSFVEPSIMYGEGEMAIGTVKEMIVTDDYLGLHENVRGCQNIEPFENCTTRQYLESVQRECNCIPYGLRDFSKDIMVFGIPLI